METIRNTAAAFCGAVAVAAVFSMLIPKAKNDRFVKLILRVFFLLCLAAPLVGEWGERKLSEEPARLVAEGRQADLETLLKRQLEEAFAENLKREAAGILSRHKVIPEKITVGVHTDEELRIEITTVEIRLKEEGGELGEALSEIKSAFGVSASVIYEWDKE